MTTTPQAKPGQSESAAPAAPARRRVRVWRRILLLSFSGLLLISMLLALAQSTGGSRWLLQSVAQLITTVTPGQLQLSGITGNLAQGLQVQQLSYQDADWRVAATQLELQMDWPALVQSHLHLTQLRLATLQLQQLRVSQEPSKPLTDLHLPLRFSVEQIDLGSVSWQAPQQLAQPIVTQASGKLSYQQSWNWQVQARTQQLHWQTQGQLAAAAPFALQASLAARLPAQFAQSGKTQTAQHSVQAATSHWFTLQSQWQGSLAALRAEIELAKTAAPTQPELAKSAQPAQPNSTSPVQLATAKLELQQVLEFKLSNLAHHLRLAKLEWQALNPAEFDTSWPHAALTGRLELQGEPEQTAAVTPAKKSASAASHQPKSASAAALALNLQLQNHQPQSWDKQGLPLQSLKLQAQLDLQQLQIHQAELTLPGQGQILSAGRIAWQQQQLSQLDLHQQLKQVNLQALDQRLQATQIQGKLDWLQAPAAAATSTARSTAAPTSTSAKPSTKTTATIATASTAKPAAHLQMQAQLRDRNAELQARADYDYSKQLLKLERFTLNAQQARLEASGKLELAQTQRFELQGKLQHLDPARWLTMPAGDISAELQLAGALASTPQSGRPAQQHWQASIHNLQGHLAAAKLLGQAELQQLANGALDIKQLQLDWGNNHLQASGVTSATSAASYWPLALRVQLQARQLQLFDEVSRALNLPYHFGGELELELQHQANRSAWQFQARNLQLAWPGQTLSMQQAQAQADLPLNQATLQQLAEFDASAKAKRGDKAPVSADWQASLQGKNWHWQKDGAPAWLQQAGQLQQIEMQMQGKPEKHQISLRQRWQNQAELSMQLQAAWQAGRGAKPSEWQAELSTLDLNLTKPAQTPLQFKLTQAAQLRWAGDKFSVQQLSWLSPWLRLELENLQWSEEGLRSRGQLRDLQALAWLNFLQKPGLVSGDLQLASDWQIDWRRSANGRADKADKAERADNAPSSSALTKLQFNLQRQRGDVVLQDEEGGRIPLALGLQTLQFNASTTASASSNEQPLQWQVQADGKRLGRWQAQGQFQLAADLSKTDFASMPLQARLQAEVADLQWLGPILNPGLLLKGRLQGSAEVAGNLLQPRYLAQVQGRELQIAFAAEGLSLANGELDLSLEQNKLKVQRLQFNQAIQAAPSHPRLRDWRGSGQNGSLSAQGEVDLSQERGSIRAEMKQFPLLQSKDRYLVVSGNAEIQEAQQVWSLVGKLQADAAYFKLPKMPAPSLSSDILIKKTQRESASKNKHVVKTRLDFSFDLGSRFVFVGRGLDTGLSGSLRLRGQDGAPLQASGSIRTEGGNYEAYGQKLEIARGILNFQDSPSNPALNVLALRRGQAVEAGVEISGTVAKPKVSLYSEPSVPDAEKLSWLVLGRGSEQLAAGDASLLMSAAGAIFGGENQRNIPREIVNGLGFDEFSIGASSSQASRLPSQTVAGSTGSHSTSNDQVLSLGKRLSPDLVLSVERGLADASGALKLSWQLSRRISINARTGNESALDVNYTFSFH